MQDDLFNFWGTTIIDPAVSGQSSTRGIDAATLGDKSSKFENLNNKFRELTSHYYKLLRVESCGSTANSIAILEATQGRTESCVFAIGSYIAGDKGYMQSLSFMSRQLRIDDRQPKGSGVFLPMKLADVITNQEQIKTHITLPYYIPQPGLHKEKFLKTHKRPSTYGQDENGCLHHYEDQCLSALHSVLFYRRIQGNPVKVILFEPVLAGCGAILSRRCYKILACLAHSHSFRFVVDEVLTFGRLGYASGLYSIEHFPKEMHSYISMITVGKWLGAGIILQRSTIVPPDAEDGRQPSTKINLNSMVTLVDRVSGKFSSMQDTRRMVLNHIGVEDEDATWGDGLLIFLPGYISGYKGATDGLKCRLLPKYHEPTVTNTKQAKLFVNGTMGTFVHVTHWSRSAINKDLMATILEYATQVRPS